MREKEDLLLIHIHLVILTNTSSMEVVEGGTEDVVDIEEEEGITEEDRIRVGEETISGTLDTQAMEEMVTMRMVTTIPPC